ncbi:MAG: hypothetical protein RMJ17_00985 [Candidatus Aenigmarchaeota archaeon]|nr:hypothetical protein [Candidatus Aenigmarchaeota archaeon]MDW8149160.1 hypothetical protein [Candidatus Aenigmarchaeota archaeon]
MVSRKTILLILFFSITFSIEVFVNVKEVFDFKKEFFNYSLKEDLLEINLFINNIGSLGFFSSLKLEINNKSIWSEEKELYPGSSKHFQVYYLFDEPGNYSIKAKLYAGDEIFYLYNFSIELKNIKEKNNTFEVKWIRVKDKFVEIKLKSKENTKAIVSIEDYPQTWKFEQKIIELLKDKWTKVRVNYEALYFEKNLTLKIFDVYSENLFYEIFNFKKESKLKGILLDFFELIGIY